MWSFVTSFLSLAVWFNVFHGHPCSSTSYVIPSVGLIFNMMLYPRGLTLCRHTHTTVYVV